MEMVSIIFFFLEILLISTETEDDMSGSHSMSVVFLILMSILVNTGVRISGFCN